MILSLLFLSAYAIDCDTDAYLNISAEEKVLAAQQLGSKNISAILTNQRVLFVDSLFNEVQSSIELDTDELTADWTSLVVDKNGDNLYVAGVLSNYSRVLKGIHCLDQSVCETFGKSQILPYVKSSIYDWQIVENTLILLDNYVLYFYNLTATKNDWTISTTKYQLDSGYFGMYWYQPKKFDVQQFKLDGQTNYKLFIVAVDYAFWLDCSVRSKQLFPYASGYIYLFQSILNYTLGYDCKFLTSPEENSTSLQSDVQIVNQGSTQIILTLRYSDFELQEYWPSKSLATFRNWSPQSETYDHFDQFSSLIYSDQKGAAAVVFYDLSETSQIINPKTYVMLEILDKYVTFTTYGNGLEYFNFLSSPSIFTLCRSTSQQQ